MFRPDIAAAIVSWHHAQLALRAYDVILRDARAALEARQPDLTRSRLESAAYVHEQLEQRGFFVQPELVERLQVLQFAAARGYL